jgi:hypothetical protein
MLDTAKIIDQSEDAISFRVDDVTPAQHLLPNEPVRTQLMRQCGRPFVAFSHHPSFQAVRAPAVHPLVNAVCFAFSEHRPLLLTPDDIWMVIAQGFAQHVNNHAERLRKRFVRHEGKVTLEVTTFNLSTPEDWAEVVDMWSEEICRHVVADFESLLVCKFTTTTPTIRTASQVVMMDAFRQYFDYVARFICGIPEITVKGTVDDWCAIRDRVAILEKYDLNWWTCRLLPICDGFIETVKGRPSEHFWQHIYSPKEVYGGNVVTGWLADLFPYLNGALTGSPTVRNPILSKSRSRLRVTDGIAHKRFPVGLSQAPISLQCERGTETEEFPLEIIGGFIGVTQKPETKYLQAEIGWAVREQDRSDHMFSKLAQFHKKGRPKNWPKGANTDAPTETSRYGVDLFGRGPSKDVIQITDQLGGGTLFGNSEHPWYVRPLDGHVNYEIAGRKELLKRFIDLPDGRYILYVLFGVQWIALAKPPMGINQNTHTQSKVIDPKQTVVIAKSFKTFFERMLQAKGAYYFDDSSFVPDGSL